MKRMSIVVAIVLAGSLLAAKVLAQAAPTSRPGKQAAHPTQALKDLNLTADQKAQVKAIVQQARAEAKNATDPQAKRQIRQATMRKIAKDVLTDQQRQQLARMRKAQARGQAMQALHLTADQKAQAKAIFQQARADAQNAADPQAKQQVRQAAFQKLKDTVLTDAQRQQLAQMRAKHEQRGQQKREKEAPRTAHS